MAPTKGKTESSDTCPAPIDLVQDIITLSGNLQNVGRFGSFSGAVYDTAWLSMIAKLEQGQVSSLFPECFDHLLNSQLEDGTWGATGSQIDGILNSLAGLLALVTWQRRNSAGSGEFASLQSRIKRCYTTVHSLFQDWKVDQSVHVGFEILVPSLLRQLESFDLRFEFPGRPALMQLNGRKLQKFKPELVYSPKATTLLHSLEAFVGLIDFDKVSHHCMAETGIFGSPSSTAAFLMNSTSWNNRAEEYLKMVVSATGGTGFVPSAYPTCLFELSWALSTLLTPGNQLRKLSESENDSLGQLFELTLDQQAGLAGFTAGVLEDADDTARCLMALQCLGKSRAPDALIEQFHTDTYFRTYKLEGSASLSANCNVLLALLGYTQVDKYQGYIERALTFLLSLIKAGSISDKWNLSAQYSRMLCVQTLIQLLEKHALGALSNLSPVVVHEQVTSSICQLLGQTLSTQGSNGSWDDSNEVTAYSIITITYCQSLPWSAEIQQQLEESIARGRQYLRMNYWTTSKLSYLWVEKVSYRSSLLYSVYCSTALNINPIELDLDSTIRQCFSIDIAYSKQMGYLIRSLPLFQDVNFPAVEMILVEAKLIACRLKEFRNMLFSRDELPMTADKYTDFIPMIWVACNHKNRHKLPAELLWQMVLLSLLNFQIDEYMESVVARMTEAELTVLMDLLRNEVDALRQRILTQGDDPKREGQENGFEKKQNNVAQRMSNGVIKPSEPSPVTTALGTLVRFMNRITQHQAVRQSPISVQLEVLGEIYNFLIAHLVHNEYNAILLKSRDLSREAGSMRSNIDHSYFKWVRSVASDDTSCPFSFLFFSCLISDPGQSCFVGAQAKYISKSLSRHLATMCRQYNDYGSARRDFEEANLNSLDFPEFKMSNKDQANRINSVHRPSGVVSDHKSSALPSTNGAGDPINHIISDSAKGDLMAIADFERACLELTREKLGEVTTESTMAKIQVFTDVTDMFGQVYVQQDIASRIKTAANLA